MPRPTTLLFGAVALIASAAATVAGGLFVGLRSIFR
jgi:hypothetical protein